MMITITVVKPFERICLDIVGALPKTLMGNMYILTLQDELSRYGLAIALSSTDAPTVAQAFIECSDDSMAPTGKRISRTVSQNTKSLLTELCRQRQ